MNPNELLAEQQQLDVHQDDMFYENDDNFEENPASEGHHQNGDHDNNNDQYQLDQQQVYDDHEDSKLKLDDDEHAPSNQDDQPIQEHEAMVEDFVINQDDVVDDNVEPGDDPENLAQPKEEAVDPNVWVLPPCKEICTLEEIRRGQVINRVAPNECPVVGCGKKINENSLEPSPGTIASGLRTHVLFVHYANRKGIKKRKLGWSTKRRSSVSPKKQFGMPHPNMHSSTPIWGEPELEGDPENYNYSPNDMLPPLSAGSSLIQRNYNNQNRNSPPGSLLNKKIKQLSAGQSSMPQRGQQSSLQSLMQATGMGFPPNSNGNTGNNGNRYSPQNKPRIPDPRNQSKNFNQTTSSLFSILAGLTQQPQHQQQSPQQQPQHQQQQHQQQHQQQSHQQQPQQQQHTQQRNNLGPHPQQPRNFKPAHSGNTISVSQCSKNNNNDNHMSNPPINSSLLSLLNDKISGNVGSGSHPQMRKAPYQNSRSNHYGQSNMSHHDNEDYNNGLQMNSISMLDHFIESVARKTGSSIGPDGVIEATKIIEKFAALLICNSQTIADHYINPFADEAPQQKSVITASDVILAYKMMQKKN